MTTEPIRAKITVVGDGNTGKSCVLTRYIRKEFVQIDYQPTVFDNKLHRVKYKKKVIELDLWDTAGQEDYSRIMPLSFPNSDLILIVYNIADPKTLENVIHKWLPEIKFHCRETPYILIGNKRDLRFETNTVQNLVHKEQKCPVNEHEGKEVAQNIKALAFFECSALNGDGVEELFDFIVKNIYKDYTKKNSFKFFKNLWRDITSCCK